MNSEQIKTFISLARTRNFSRTAEELIIAQSTVSKRIRDLENEFGCPLFMRGAGGVFLTSAGKIFLAYAQQFSNIEEKAHTEIQYTELYGSHVILGTTYDYYDMHLYKKLHHIAHDYPDIAFQIKFGQTGALLQDLKRAVIDIAFTHHPLHHMDYMCKK